MPSGQSFDLADEILCVLNDADRPLWASEIAESVSATAGFEVERRDVNRCLYGAKLRDNVKQLADSKWTSARASRSTATPGSAATTRDRQRRASTGRSPVTVGRRPPWDRFARLVSYYLDCVRADESDGAECFLSDAGKRFMPLPLEEEWSLSGTDVVDLQLADVPAGFLAELRKLGASGALFYGYPLAVRWVDRSARGWSGGFAIPAFLQPIELVLEGSVLSLTLGDDPPRPNPKFLEWIASSAEERRALLDELGLSGEDDDALENGLADLAVRLVQTQPQLEPVEAIDPTALATSPSLAELSAGGLYNRAVVVMGERSKYTQGLEAELEKLRDSTPDSALSESALSLLFTGATVERPPGSDSDEVHTIAEVVALNDEQREAVRAGMTEPMTVVTGPPGTGKSQVVLTLLANAYLRGESVLFSSRNNKAVNVVEQRLNSIAGFPLVVRAGTKAGDRNLRAELIDFLTRLLSLSVSERDRQAYADAQAALLTALARRDSLWMQVEELRLLRNEVDALDRQVEEASRAYDGGAWAAVMDRFWSTEFPDLESAVALADKYANPRGGVFGALGRAFSRKGDYAALDQAVRELARFQAVLGAQPVALAGGALGPTIEYLQRARQLRDDCRLLVRYVDARDRLVAADCLEDLAGELAEADEHVWDRGAIALKAHCELVPDRVTSTVRKDLGEFRATLERLSGDRLGGRTYAKLAGEMQSLFQKVTPILPTWCVTNLSARSTLPFAPALFDLLIIDEASQCDIASAIPLLFRARRVVVIGDPQQLRHISQLDPHRDQQLQAKYDLTSARDMPYTFTANSLFDLGMGVAGAGRVISLREHFRSHFDIIEFSNRQWYGGSLRVCTDYRRLRAVPASGERSVAWTAVRGKVERPRSGGAVNDAEAKAAVAEVVRLMADEGFTGTVGLVTPFRAQANRMKDLAFKALPPDVVERSELIVDTAHGFQGDERDVIIFSPCVSAGLPRGAQYFLSKTGNVFNVAVSRARSLLHVVGDLDACRACGVPHMQAFAEYYDSLAHDALDPAGDPTVGPWELPLKAALEAAGLRPMPQYALHQYRLDLALVQDGVRLDIEVDGELYHKEWDGTRCRDDVVRDRRILALGWHIKRFWVYQLRDDLDGCVRDILATLEVLASGRKS